MGGRGSLANVFDASWQTRICSAIATLACLGAIVCLHAPVPPPQRYRELENVDSAIESKLRAVWEASNDNLSRYGLRPGQLEAVKVARSLGAGSALPLLKLIVDDFRHANPRTIMTTPYWRDATAEPLFACLAELAQPSVNPVLVRILEDAAAHEELRRGAVIALAWPGNRNALEPLVRRALDRQERNNLRKAILLRIARLELPAPAALRELLDEPFDGIDQLAAGALVLMGDPEAPSLVLDGIQGSEFDLQCNLLIAAASKLTHGEIRSEEVELPTGLLHRHGDIERAHSQLEKWIASHPDGLETEFEKARCAYLESPARKREMSLPSIEAVLSAREEDSDFASAALLIHAPEKRGASLEKLHRLAARLKNRLEGKDGPGAILEALNSYLLKRHGVRPEWAVERGLDSYLSFVLEYDTGNCIGYTSLYLALAERLDLPLFGVASPGHVFVRWDDGKLKRNAELTEFGTEYPDASYAIGIHGESISPDLIRNGTFLANRTRREILGDILTNRAATYIAEQRFQLAMESAENALRLNPKAYAANAERGLAVFELRLDGAEEALLEIDRGIQLYPSSCALHITKANLLLRLDRFEEAVADIDCAEKAVPSEISIIRTRARAIALAGRTEEARKLLEAAEARPPSAPEEVRLARLTLEVQRNPAKARDLLESPTPDDLKPYLAAARGLLHPPADGNSGAQDALALLGKVSSLAEGTESLHSPSVSRADARAHQLLRARALLLLGRRDEAREVLWSVEADGFTNHEVLELRRDLGETDH